ncbi:MAG: hypothetical protein U1E53_16475 [Dongiaceae bacterium]
MSGAPGAAALAEIERLHRFFEAWFRGTLPRDGASFAACAGALAADFVQVDPQGNENGRADLLARLEAAHGCRAGAPFAIAVEDARILLERDGLVLAGYVERQAGGGTATVRRSTALLAPDPAAPLGIAWLHLQETWIAPPAGT